MKGLQNEISNLRRNLDEAIGKRDSYKVCISKAEAKSFAVYFITRWTLPPWHILLR